MTGPDRFAQRFSSRFRFAAARFFLSGDISVRPPREAPLCPGLLIVLVLLVVGLLACCGGSSGGGGSSNPPPPSGNWNEMQWNVGNWK